LTIDKSKFQAVIEQIVLTEDSNALLKSLVDQADESDPFITDFEVIEYKIEQIRVWASQKILEANQEMVMNGFLSELKVVFDKYAAKLEIGSSESGYGTSYGTGGTAGVKFTATLDGVIASKVINKSVIVGSDFV